MKNGAEVARKRELHQSGTARNNNSAMAKKPKPTPTEIERIYNSGQNRLTQERNDFLLPQVIDFVKEKKWLNLRPEYQRRLVWDARKKSLFIESLLMNIPSVIVTDDDVENYIQFFRVFSIQFPQLIAAKLKSA